MERRVAEGGLFRQHGLSEERTFANPRFRLLNAMAQAGVTGASGGFAATALNRAAPGYVGSGMKSSLFGS